MNIVVAVWLVGFALCAYWSLFKILPECAASRFRYRLWEMRDELANEILDDTYENREQPLRLLKEMEMAITVSADVTLLRYGLLKLGRMGLASLPKPDPIRLEGLTVSDAERLGAWRERLARAFLHHVFFGSPSGWIATIVVLVTILPAVLLRRAISLSVPIFSPALTETKAHVRDEIDFDDDLPAYLAVLSGRRTGRRHRLAA